MIDTAPNRFWIGKDFLDWCIADANANDDRKIHYTLVVHTWIGETERKEFTSDDKIDFVTMLRIRQSEILDMKLVDNEWYFILEYYGITIYEASKMKFPSREAVESIRNRYPAGCRVELVQMDDPQAPPKGTKGTVYGVDDTGSVLVHWDNGSGLNVVYGEDMCRRCD